MSDMEQEGQGGQDAPDTDDQAGGSQGGGKRDDDQESRGGRKALPLFDVKAPTTGAFLRFGGR